MVKNPEQTKLSADMRPDALSSPDQQKYVTYTPIGVWQSHGGVNKHMVIVKNSADPAGYSIYKQEHVDGTSESKIMNLGALTYRIFHIDINIFPTHFEVQPGTLPQQAAEVILQALNWTKMEDQAPE